MQKIPTRFRGTNFYTSLARFAPNSVRQPNGPKCAQIIRNVPKCQFRVQWVGSVRSLRKIVKQLRGTNFCTCSAHFALSSVRQPNGQMHPNSTKHTKILSLGSNGVDLVCSLRKMPTCCTCSARFAPSSVRQPNGPKCTQIVRNTPKRQFRVQWGRSGVFLEKNSDATSWHELLH